MLTRMHIPLVTAKLKYCLLLLTPLLAFHNARGNIIDSLKTKEEVQKFLRDNLHESGIVFVHRCPKLSQTEKTRIYLSLPDTVMVEDPFTGEIFMKFMQRDSTYLSNWDAPNAMESVNYPFDSIASWMDNNSWEFYKTDIDGNGYADMVVSAGILMVVMDMVHRVEGHMFSPTSALTFKKILALPDGSSAIEVVHDHEQCEAWCNKIDTIVYKYGGFVKYNPTVKPGGIAKIYYHHISSIHGYANSYTCIEINKNGQCYMRYSGRNNSTFPQYDTVVSAILDNKRLDELWSFITYIDVKSKKDIYAGWWVWNSTMEEHSGTFTIYFDDGTINKISVTGHPPLDLGYFSKNISDISQSLQWLRATNVDFNCPHIVPYTYRHVPADLNNIPCECDW